MDGRGGGGRCGESRGYCGGCGDIRERLHWEILTGAWLGQSLRRGSKTFCKWEMGPFGCGNLRHCLHWENRTGGLIRKSQERIQDFFKEGGWLLRMLSTQLLCDIMCAHSVFPSKRKGFHAHAEHFISLYRVWGYVTIGGGDPQSATVCLP